MGKTIYLYQTGSGKKVIANFIDSVDVTTQARIRNALRLLEEYGFDTSAGQSIKKLSANPSLFEIRITGKQPIRLLFIGPTNNTFFIIHIFIKKTQKTPLKELRLAKKRALEIINL